MFAHGWRRKLLASTRGRVLSLLRRGPRTVAELAETLGLTTNAVRIHLSVLERDGLVAQEGVRRGIGKPAYVFQLTPDADALFPKGYAAILAEVLTYVRQDQGAEGLQAFLRAVGRRAGQRSRSNAPSLGARAKAAAEVLRDLGGLAEVEESKEGLMIRGYSCPLPGIVADHPEACALAEEMVAGIVGAAVQECCDRSGPNPRCAFRIELDSVPIQS